MRFCYFGQHSFMLSRDKAIILTDIVVHSHICPDYVGVYDIVNVVLDDPSLCSNDVR